MMVDGCHDQTMRVAPRWLLLSLAVHYNDPVIDVGMW